MASSYRQEDQVTDEVIRNRLVQDGEAKSDTKKLNTLSKQFLDWCYMNPNEDDPGHGGHPVRNALSCKTEQMKTMCQKTCMQISAQEEHLKTLRNINSELRNQKEFLEKNISSIKKVLEKQQTLVMHRKQCDLYASVVDSLPQKTELERRIQTAEKENLIIKKIHQDLQCVLTTRKMHVALLVDIAKEIGTKCSNNPRAPENEELTKETIDDSPPVENVVWIKMNDDVKSAESTESFSQQVVSVDNAGHQMNVSFENKEKSSSETAENVMEVEDQSSSAVATCPDGKMDVAKCDEKKLSGGDEEADSMVRVNVSDLIGYNDEDENVDGVCTMEFYVESSQ